jgi:hypothetical protein
LLEAAIKKLSLDDLAALAEWFDRYRVKLLGVERPVRPAADHRSKISTP